MGLSALTAVLACPLALFYGQPELLGVLLLLGHDLRCSSCWRAWQGSTS